MSFNHFKVWEIKLRWKFMFKIIINQSESSTCLSTHSQTSSRTYLRHNSRIHGLDATHCAPNIIWVIWPIAVSICLSTLFFNPLLNPLWTHNWWHYMVSFKRTARITHPFLKEFAPVGNFGVRCPVVSPSCMDGWINQPFHFYSHSSVEFDGGTSSHGPS